MLMNHNAEQERKYHQNTISFPIDCIGVGLHSGKTVKVKFLPAEANSGITYVRTDIKTSNNVIQAIYSNVVDTRMCTVIANPEGASVSTIEHLMAALRGLEIDNLRVEIDGPEMPIMDGSSAMFIFLLECAGIKALPAMRRYIKVLKEVRVDRGDASASYAPSDACDYTLTLHYNHPFITTQKLDFKLEPSTFKSGLSRARTYGFLEDLDSLQKAGLGLGGSLNNVLVIDQDKVLNENGLRYSDELVRHKVLDAVGDLYLAGAPILGHFEGYKSGHEMNNKLLRAIFASEENWCYADPEHTELPHDEAFDADMRLSA